MEIPDGPDEITAHWLSAALGSPIETFQVTPVGGWRGDVFRVTLSDRSVIAKLSSSRPGMRERSVDLYVREVRFYRELAEHTALKVPTCFHADVDEESGRHVLLLEDVGPTLSQDCTVEQAQQAVLAIAQFHGEWWGKAPGWASGPIDAGSSEAAHETAWPEFLRRAGHRLPSELHRLGERLGEHRDDLHRRVFAPQTLIHRDFGTANMTFDPLCVFDWQAVRAGTGPWDVAIFLAMNLEPVRRRTIEQALIEQYADDMPGYSLAQCREDYGYALLLRLSMEILEIAALPFERRMLQRDVDVILPRLCAAALDNDAHELLP